MIRERVVHHAEGKGESGAFVGDLSKSESRINLLALWVMMTSWGARSERAERYREYFQPRWV